MHWHPSITLDLSVRKGVRGLATAVIYGLKEARGRFLLSMDGDILSPSSGSHTSKCSKCLNQGADFVVGSRYVTGGCVPARDGGYIVG